MVGTELSFHESVQAIENREQVLVKQFDFNGDCLRSFPAMLRYTAAWTLSMIAESETLDFNCLCDAEAFFTPTKYVYRLHKLQPDDCGVA